MQNQIKQIEEMCEAIASVICEVYNPMCDEYKPHTCSNCYSNSTTIGDLAEMLYNAGYRKQSEWISVEDDLPKNQFARVLVFLKDDEFTKPIGFNKIDTDRYIDGEWVRWGKSVTHWMILPEAPKMKGGE